MKSATQILIDGMCHDVITHIAGAEIVIGGRYQRQICSWCGAALVDNDLAMMASADGLPPGAWKCGTLVDVSGLNP